MEANKYPIVTMKQMYHRLRGYHKPANIKTRKVYHQSPSSDVTYQILLPTPLKSWSNQEGLMTPKAITMLKENSIEVMEKEDLENCKGKAEALNMYERLKQMKDALKIVSVIQTTIELASDRQLTG